MLQEKFLPGAPCWVDLLTSDTDRSREFYSRLFGWEAQESAPEFGGYFNFTKNGQFVAGCMGQQEGTQGPDRWSVYLFTENAKKTADTAANHGGEILVEPMDVGDLGTMAIVRDVGGAEIGMWKPGRHRGFGIAYESGAPSWFELNTRDYKRVIEFYRDVFRWDTHTMSNTPEFRYTTLAQGETNYAGIMDVSQSPEAPLGWSVYFGLDDADAGAAEIVRLGGRVLHEPEDTPYGKIGMASDPTGAVLLFVAPNEMMPARD